MQREQCCTVTDCGWETLIDCCFDLDTESLHIGLKTKLPIQRRIHRSGISAVHASGAARGDREFTPSQNGGIVILMCII